jgi:hypothetical protein
MYSLPAPYNGNIEASKTASYNGNTEANVTNTDNGYIGDTLTTPNMAK